MDVCCTAAAQTARPPNVVRQIGGRMAMMHGSKKRNAELGTASTALLLAQRTVVIVKLVYSLRRCFVNLEFPR